MFVVAMEIIHPSLRTFLAGVGILALATLGSASEVVLQKVPPLTVEQAPAYPENLARYTLGAQVEVTPKTGGNSDDALLSGDPTVGYAINTGTTTILVSLARIENIDRVSFVTQGAKGHLTIAISNAKLPGDAAEWNAVAEQDFSDAAVKAKIGPSEAKYLRLTFNVNEPGRIGYIGVYSTSTVAAFTMPRSRTFGPGKSESLAMVSYNLTDLHTKARAIYVSSGDDVKQANNMIDDQPETVYNFSSPDAAPTAVVDLGKLTKLRRIAALYSPARAKVDFYVMQTLPGAPQSASAKSLRVDDAALAGMTQVGSVNDDGSGRAAVDFPETTGRYILVKWTPADQGSPFSVAEIAAFGNGQRENLVAANESAEASFDGKDFKDFGDAKEMPEEGPPAEGPPQLPPVPPPFVFTPVVVPNSP
jgi:hypothetical protein